MAWSKLLCPTRQRELLGGLPSEAESDEHRAEFDRDYDRSLFSTPVRRLQDKAQVFPLEPNDSVRTRLTHSLEVSAVSRNIVRRLIERARTSMPNDTQGAHAVQTIAATCGLLHDLGNPPFGHSGESTIQSWFATRYESLREPHSSHTFDDLSPQHRNDFLKFDGNAQTLRLLTKLQVLSDWHGLNLTAGTLAAAFKYTASSNDADPSSLDNARRKPGYFASENELVRAVRDATGVKTSRHPLTCIVEAADDIVYSIVDLEDGIKKGVLDWDTLVNELKHQCTDPALDAILRAATARVDANPMHLAGRSRHEALIKSLRTLMIGRTIAAAVESYESHESEIMQHAFNATLLSDSSAASLVTACKQIGRRHVYAADEVTRREIAAQRILHDLMDLFWQAAHDYTPAWIANDGHVIPASHSAKVYSILSQNYRTVFQHALETKSHPPLYSRLQLITDNVAGMTDTYACTLHQKLVTVTTA